MMDTLELAYDVYETPETRQDKCPILFLHGLFWNKYMLRDLAEALCLATQRKVYCLDLRCHDKSPFSEECNAQIMAEDIKRFIKDRGLAKVAFVCHSVSCTISYLVAIDEPEMVEKLVMIDQAPYPAYTDRTFDEDVNPQYLAQKRFLDKIDPGTSLSSAKCRIFSMSDAATNEGQRVFLRKVAYELTKAGNKFGWKTDHDFLIKGYRENFRPTPRGRSDHEFLFIRCKDSTRIPDEKFEAILRYNPNSKLLTIDDSTHLLMFEQPEQFLAAVKDFLA